MRLKPLYQEKLADVEQKAIERGLKTGLQQGLQQGERLVVENMLKVRFGELDAELSGVIEAILALPPEEFTPLLMHLSREELVARFRST
ncbi:hypothetical protein [Chroococcus sp. FPU101]|uniref:hypothetical protein n=1 Tax=Chroococcus sp. FPU101 TaxID=1974212 RepID=UPI001AAB8AA3|nr:hypothetical protein CFPU101_20660 [Chroococcus sp. FPU101]